MSERTLKILIYIAGALCLYAFVAIRFEVLFNGILKENVVEGYWDKTQYGELYYFSMIRHFREEGLPPAKEKFEHSEKQASIEEAEILVFGDSFFEFSRHKQFAERLSDDFSRKVHYVNNDFPLEYLATHGYQDTTPKMVLFQRVERYIPVAFEDPHTIPGPAPAGEEPPPLVKSLIYMKDKIFYSSSEQLYDALLKRSYLTTGIYSHLVTLKFDIYGSISGLTPVYHLDDDQSWLFYHDQVNDAKTSFYYRHTGEEMDSICDHMAGLQKKLKEYYNMELIYLPVPAKFTLYHDLVDPDTEYNQFLPRLYEGLNERRVRYVNIFDDFLESDTLLYYRTDSHWNQKGIDIAYRETLEAIRSNPELKPLLYRRNLSSL